MADIQALRQMAIDAHLLSSSDDLPGRLLAFARAVEAAERERAVPDKPTQEMIDALRTGSRRDCPSDELCRIRYAALLAAIKRANHG